MEPHLARHGVQVQRGHVRWAGGGASLIMSLAMLLLSLIKKCAWNILRREGREGSQRRTILFSMKNDGRAVIAVIEERGLFIERALSYVFHTCLVDAQRPHDIVRLLFAFSHAERKLVEGSLNEECASTAANQRRPPNVSHAVVSRSNSPKTWYRTHLCPPSAPGP